MRIINFDILFCFSRAALFFVAVLFFLMFPIFTLAQTVTISPQNSNVNVNQLFSIDVLISSAINVFGMGFDLAFDPSLLVFDSAVDGGFLSRNGVDQISLMTGVNPSGNLVFGITRLGAGSGGISGNGTIAKLYFRSLAVSGASTLSFSKNNICVLSGDSCNYVSATWQGGNVAISSVSTSSDITPPTVSITSPSSGSTVSGTITVSATASDNVAVAGVQFKLDGANLGVEDTTSPYSISWNTTAVSNGSHTLTATARDTSGNQTTSNSITITVNNVIATTPPSGGGGGGGTLIDTTPPSLPSNTKISMSGNQVVITWTNPTDSDFKGIVIVRKEGSSPTSRTDGNIVYNNNLQNFIDLIDSTKTYYYAVYSYDTNNNYSQPIILKAEPGQTQIISQPAPTTQQPQPSTSVSIIIPPTISSNFVFTRYLTIGKSGEEVKKLQELLSANPTIYPEQLITGYYGPATQRAVQRFQETYGIASPSTPGYGEVGPSTRSKLNYFISYRGTYSPSTYSTSTTTSTKPLSKAELIAQLKELIRQIEARILVLLEQLKKLRAGQQ